LHTWEVEHTTSQLGTSHKYSSFHVRKCWNCCLWIFCNLVSHLIHFTVLINPNRPYFLPHSHGPDWPHSLQPTKATEFHPHPHHCSANMDSNFFTMKKEEAHSSDTSVSTHISELKMLKSNHFLFPPCMLHVLTTFSSIIFCNNTMNS